MQSPTVAGSPRAADGAPPVDDPLAAAPGVLRLLWADPPHMAEHLALWSLQRFGPRAGRAVAALGPGERAERRRRAIERQAHVAATEGAFVGGPFLVLIPVAFCAALLAQAQLVFELAAIDGRDPVEEERAAELLALLGAYPTTESAAAALAAVPRDTHGRDGPRLPRKELWTMVRRMAYLLQVATPDDGRSRLRAAVGWTGIGVLVLVGFVLPLVWVPYMAWSMRRSTLRLAARAQVFYGGAAIAPRGPGTGVSVGGVVAFGRTVVLVVLPVVALLVALLTGFDFAGGRWLTAGVVLLVVSALLTGAWLGYRAWRLRRQGR